MVEVTREKVRATWHHLAAVESPQAEEPSTGPVFVALDGTNHVVEESALAAVPLRAAV